MINSIHPLIRQKISELEMRYPIVDHPLIRGIAIRHFNLEQMHLIAERFYHVIKNFPRFLAGMISHWDDTEARMPLVDNLFEEHGRMNKREIHVNTYLDFLNNMGIDTVRIKASKASPATLSYIQSVLHVCTHGHPNLGLGALGYIEDIVHQVSAIIGTAAKKEKTCMEHVSHFGEHEILDEQHSKEIYTMLNLQCQTDIDAAFHGLTMGAYFHYQLYETILSEILYESGLHRSQLVFPQENKSIAYPLRTGVEGKKRLEILNRLYNNSSINFISEQASPTHKSFLEFGCGTGQLSYELSEKKPDWHITAVDNSPFQIDLAQSLWPQAPHRRFLVADVESLTREHQRFDVIYVRWVLIYQKHLDEFIQVFSERLNDGGVLIIEDNEPGQSGCFSPTHQSNIDNWHNFWTQAVSFVGQTPGFCARLCEIAARFKLSLKHFAISQQLLQTREEKEVFLLGILESEDAIMQAGLSKSAFDEIASNAAKLSHSEMPIGFVRNFQVCFKK